MRQEERKADLEEDIPRAERWLLIRGLKLSPFNYRNASGRLVSVNELGLVKSCLMILVSHCGGQKNTGRSNEGCCITIHTLATEMCVSRAAATRGMAACRGLGVVESRPSHSGESWHRINWRNVRTIAAVGSLEADLDTGVDSLGVDSLEVDSDRVDSLGTGVGSLGNSVGSLGATGGEDCASYPRARGFKTSKDNEDKEGSSPSPAEHLPGNAAFVSGYSPEFEIWWSVYPRRAKKRAAWEAYQATIAELIASKGLADEQAHELLIAAAREFANSPAGQGPGPDGDFRPNPDSWLVDHRFEDDRETWRQPNGSSKPSKKPRIAPLSQQPKRRAIS